jgi:hypothetical protein
MTVRVIVDWLTMAIMEIITNVQPAGSTGLDDIGKAYVNLEETALNAAPLLGAVVRTDAEVPRRWFRGGATPNQAVERTATRLVLTSSGATMLLVLSAPAPGRRRSPWSR